MDSKASGSKSVGENEVQPPGTDLKRSSGRTRKPNSKIFGADFVSSDFDTNTATSSSSTTSTTSNPVVSIRNGPKNAKIPKVSMAKGSLISEIIAL